VCIKLTAIRADGCPRSAGYLGVAVAMIWFARPGDGESLPWFKKAWIIGQVYVMTAMLFVVCAATVLGNKGPNSWRPFIR